MGNGYSAAYEAHRDAKRMKEEGKTVPAAFTTFFIYAV